MGVPKDDAKAMHWFRKAAEQGHADAQGALGNVYGRGEIIPQDDGQAYAWLSIAAAQGQPDAARYRDFVARQMGPHAHDRAQRLSQDYWKNYVEPFRN